VRVECIEGNSSIRVAVRITGAAKNTVTKATGRSRQAFGRGAGPRSYTTPWCRTLQAGEIWACCYSKQKNASQESTSSPSAVRQQSVSKPWEGSRRQRRLRLRPPLPSRGKNSSAAWG
jgi:hypothetical protein